LQYTSFIRKLHKTMPPPEVDGLELHELLTAKAKESWLRDSKGGAFLTRKMFGDAVFSFAYAWVVGATAENYVQFLQGLFSLLTEEVGREKWCWKEDVHPDDRLTMPEEAAPAPAPRPAFVAMTMPGPKPGVPAPGVPAPKPANSPVAVPKGCNIHSPRAFTDCDGCKRAALAQRFKKALTKKALTKASTFSLSSPRAHAPAPAPAPTPVYYGGYGSWGPPPPRQEVMRVRADDYVLPRWPGHASPPPPVTGGRDMWSSQPSRWADKHSLVHTPWASNSAAPYRIEGGGSEVGIRRLVPAEFPGGTEQRQAFSVLPCEMCAVEREPEPVEEHLFELPQQEVRRMTPAERQAKNALSKMAQRLTLGRVGPPVGETLKHLARSGYPG
jgi:hypothetical protein